MAIKFHYFIILKIHYVSHMNQIVFDLVYSFFASIRAVKIF